MSPRLFPVFAWLRHWLLEVDEHSIHAPFLYELYTTVIRGATDTGLFSEIENYRHGLLANQNPIEVTDLGGGSKHFNSHLRTIAAIAATSPATVKQAQFYYRLAHFRQPASIIELGTSFGLSTLYLARAIPGPVYTLEGSPAIAAIAQLQFDFLKQTNIRLREGNIDETLPRLLDELPQVDFVLMDANHRLEPSVRYFEWLARKSKSHTVIIVDDIHASAEMEAAWNHMRQHELVYVNVDLFHIGLLIFDPALHKQSLVASL
jgi:predicted O-methyltransferase YrrM